MLTPATCQPSTQATGYMRTLLAEWILGEPSSAGVSQFMDRGTALEPEARKRYAWERDVEVKEVGIILRDDRMAGASPDGLVGEDGTLEIKTPGAATHIGHLLDSGAGLRGYFAQVQGALWLSGRRWADVISYNPAMPLVVLRIARDEEYIQALSDAIDAFVARLLGARERLTKEHGCQPATRLLIPAHMATDTEPF